MIPRRWIHILPSEYNEVLNPSHPLLSNYNIVSQWEKEFGNFIGSPNTVALPSGRIGLKLILQYLNLQENDEVIIPALTLKALVSIIKSLGLKPVCADIDPKTLNIDPESVRNLITPRTKAIIALHTFGNPCLIEEICKIGQENNIPVIEDAAHACGAKIQNKFVGTFGYAGFFSFDISKPINTYGGGMLVSEDLSLIDFVREYNKKLILDTTEITKKAKSIKLEQALYKLKLMYPILFLRLFRFFFKSLEFVYRKIQSVPPENIQFTPLQASIGIEKLSLLNSRIAQRNEVAQLYRKLLSDKIDIPYVTSECIPSYYMFVVILPKKSHNICRSLLFHGIDTAFKEEVIDDVSLLVEKSHCPNANGVYPYLLALPFYDVISKDTIEYICNCLNELVE
ncbi:MAG TPA: DegT/DnrJ/EryC1/StrS family aminotransferase [Candidatus Hydrogenedens sp.]|nr:DegT/DnrJ/EryC1/StrS family aminotransferase [Candidatus Hydrogenedens sp.]